jgi:hypothetical protein
VTLPLHQLIREQSESILAQAVPAVQRAHLSHYPASDPEVVRERLSRLLDLTARAVEDRNLGPILEYSRELGEQRFRQGYPLSEVQTAINVLEEALWEHCVRLLPSNELAHGLGLCSTTLGATKDRLARTYVSLASGTHAASLNLQALFEGIE